VRWALALVGALVLAHPAAVGADSFTPIRLSVLVSAVARADRPLPVRVTVSADPAALDARHGPMRAQVKLTRGECGGTYVGTSGPALLDRVLAPQPSPGRAYSGSAHGSARVRGYATYTVCAYLGDDYEQFATQTDEQTVVVSRGCTRAATLYDRHRSAARRRAARRACGAGVAL
jgi:hypothetical protein